MTNHSWMRVAFELGPWPSPGDPGWAAAHDALVDERRATGATLYGVLEAALAPGSPDDVFGGADASGEDAEAWIGTWVDNAATVIRRYADRVSVFELLPAPNRPTAALGPVIDPRQYARLVTELHRELSEGEAPAVEARLVLGGLAGGGEGDLEAAAYVRAVYAAGREAHGWPPSESGPLHGVACHPRVGDPYDLDTMLAALDGLGAADAPVYISGITAGAGDVTSMVGRIDAEPRLILAAGLSVDDGPVFVEEGSRALAPETASPFLDLAVFPPPAPPRASRDLPPDVPEADGFDFPVGAPDGSGYWIASFVATDEYWNLFKAWHTGEDWNRGSGDTDLGDAIYAIAHGLVTAADYFTPSWGNVALVEHRLPDGNKVWSQYAHLKDLHVAVGDVVSRGQQIGTLGKGAPTSKSPNGWPAHLHFEIRVRDLKATNWSPMVKDKGQVLAHYAEPKTFIDANRPGQPTPIGDPIIVDDDASAPSGSANGRFTRADVPNWKKNDGGYGGGAWYTFGARRDEANVAMWAADLPEAGHYMVYAYVPSTHATTRNAAYTVTHADGETVARIDQSRYYNNWVPLGRFTFEDRGTVRLTDVTGEADANRREVAYDAVKWVRVAE